MLDIQPSETKSETVRPQRPREHLTEAEIERLMTVARHDGRYGHRDATAILVAFRHGLRASELIDLQWDQIDFVQKTIRINRVKNGSPATATAREPAGTAYLRLRTGRSGHDGMVPQDDGSARGASSDAVPHPPTHAQALLRLPVCQPGQGYALAPSLPRAPQHPIDGEVHRHGPRSLPGLGATLDTEKLGIGMASVYRAVA